MLDHWADTAKKQKVSELKYMTSGEKLLALVGIVESIKSNYNVNDLTLIDLSSIMHRLGCDLIGVDKISLESE